MDSKRMRSIPMAVVSILLSLFILGPILLPYGHVSGLDGMPMFIEYQHLWATMNPVSGVAYWIGDLLCHQEAGRSLVINGSQMPVCIRDVSIFVGFLSCGAMMLLMRVDLTYRVAIVAIALSVALMFVDHSVQMVFQMDVPITRVLTGSLFGASCYLGLESWFQRYEP